jgi:hypothetical protein
MSTRFSGGCQLPGSRDLEGGFDASRQALVEQLNQIDERLRPYEELVEARRRVTSALAALEGQGTIKKRLRWEQIAEYVAEHPGAMPAEIAAALEITGPNAHAHLSRNEGTIFERRGDGWHILEGWEIHRRDKDDR